MGQSTGKVYAVVPPKTEYSITEKRQRAVPIIETLHNFGIQLREEKGINVAHYRDA